MTAIMHIPTPAERAAEVDALRASARQHDLLHHINRADVLKFMRALSQDGYMPTHAEYNAVKPREWPLAHNLRIKLRTTWRKLAADAGLKLQPKGGR